MTITFTDIHWRNSDDSDVFNIHAIKSITLKDGIVTIEGTSGKFAAPFYGLTYGGGITHYEFVTVHPYYHKEYISIAIFVDTAKVCVVSHSSNVPAWFENKCNNYCI